MIVGLMQPYFFPYVGYFDLIHEVDLWVVFDTVQYIRRGWMNRNRVLHPDTGWQYINVPIDRCPQTTAIEQVQIVATHDWRSRILGQLQHYRRHAPGYELT
ncbi:MAG: WbqC family protein, partial [Planctomycetales bacterium]|nr:WbqC family protein [Planctomycetales bacterium]